MEKRKGKSLNAIYRNPLPIDLSLEKYGPLPVLIPHNPVSCLYYMYHLVRVYLSTPPMASRPPVAVEMVGSGTNTIFQVNNEEGMARLWSHGFFGKGTLSRSDPLWKERVQRRLNLAGSQAEATMEEITNVRREERKKFKELRSKFQKLEAKLRQQTLTEAEVEEWKKTESEMQDAKMSKNNFLVDEPVHVDMRKEDQVLIDMQTMELRQNLEVSMLQKTEVFFLRFALDVVEVSCDEKVMSLQELFEACAGGTLLPDSKFVLEYVVYHHFRSLGWCVRSGIKFGCDFLLYKRGPPFMHAEYTVLVISSTQDWKAWEDVMSVSRVVSGVKKILILVYVDVPSPEDFNMVYTSEMNEQKFRELFSLYRVTEVVWRRWNPSRTRD